QQRPALAGVLIRGTSLDAWGAPETARPFSFWPQGEQRPTIVPFRHGFASRPTLRGSLGNGSFLPSPEYPNEPEPPAGHRPDRRRPAGSYPGERRRVAALANQQPELPQRPQPRGRSLQPTDPHAGARQRLEVRRHL